MADNQQREEFEKGVYVGTINAQYYRTQGAHTIFSLDVDWLGKEQPSGGLKDVKVKKGTIDLFMNEEQLAVRGPQKEGEKRRFPNTLEILKHLGCEGYTFEQLEPDAKNGKSLKGVKIRAWGAPQKPDKKTGESRAHFGQFSILIDTARAPRESQKGAGRSLDAIFRKALGTRPKIGGAATKDDGTLGGEPASTPAEEKPTTPTGQIGGGSVQSPPVDETYIPDPPSDDDHPGDELPF